MPETEQNRAIRNPDGTFAQGTAPGPGRPPDTEEVIIQKKAVKEIVKEYKESLAEVLPALSTVLKEKALTGDIPAIKEVHDRVMDKAPQAITGAEGGALVITFDNAFNETKDVLP